MYGNRVADAQNLPADASAWIFTAARSRLNALSAGPTRMPPGKGSGFLRGAGVGVVGVGVVDDDDDDEERRCWTRWRVGWRRRGPGLVNIDVKRGGGIAIVALASASST